MRPVEVVFESSAQDFLLKNSQLAILPRRAMLLQQEDALSVLSIKEVH